MHFEHAGAMPTAALAAVQTAEAQAARARAWLKRPPAPTLAINLRSAIRLFESAGDGFLAASRLRSAGSCYAAAGDAESRLDGCDLTAASLYSSAADAAVDEDPVVALQYRCRASEFFSRCGQHRAAAVQHLRAVHSLAGDHAWTESANHYTSASECYALIAEMQAAARCRAHAGDHLVTADDLIGASSAYLAAAAFARDHNLAKYCAPGLVLDAVLCAVARMDLSAARSTVAASSAVDILFAAGREQRFALDLAESCAAGDAHKFMDHVWNFDSARMLRPVELRYA